MHDCARNGRALPVALLAALLGLCADPAFADLTVFAGRTATAPRTAVGAALGLPLEPFGLEFEYAGMPADQVAGAPALQTGLVNLMVGTPLRTGRRIQVYASVGGGAYRERREAHTRTGLAVGAGGGAYVRLAGPVRARVDYRLLAFRGEAHHRRLGRAYAGLDVAF